MVLLLLSSVTFCLSATIPYFDVYKMKEYHIKAKITLHV